MTLMIRQKNMQRQIIGLFSRIKSANPMGLPEKDFRDFLDLFLYFFVSINKINC